MNIRLHAQAKSNSGAGLSVDHALKLWQPRYLQSYPEYDFPVYFML